MHLKSFRPVQFVKEEKKNEIKFVEDYAAKSATGLADSRLIGFMQGLFNPLMNGMNILQPL